MGSPCKGKLIRGFLHGQLLPPPLRYSVYSPGFWTPTFWILHTSGLLAHGLFASFWMLLWYMLPFCLITPYFLPDPHRTNRKKYKVITYLISPWDDRVKQSGSSWFQLAGAEMGHKLPPNRALLILVIPVHAWALPTLWHFFLPWLAFLVRWTTLNGK